jgi:hypothetical protein
MSNSVKARHWRTRGRMSLKVAANSPAGAYEFFGEARVPSQPLQPPSLWNAGVSRRRVSLRCSHHEQSRLIMRQPPSVVAGVPPG